MSDQKPNLDSLFEAAVEIESLTERAAFLDRSCGDDAELREQIDQLLASNEQAESFLEQPAVDLDATFLTSPAAGDRAASLEAGLAAMFGEDAAVVIGNAGHSVLASLGQTVDMPRVVLRESQVEGDGPIARPKSPEMPRGDSDSRYRLDGEIARGGMGAIIKGRDTDLGRDLAIKVLLDSHKDKPEVIQRFVEEAQIGGQLQHPGIAPIYELGQFSDKRPFFAMKLVKGQTLSKLLADREDAADERGKFIGIFEQVCQTMAYAHSRGVIHRDLKPANIMVGAFGEVQVMDWGLAKVLLVGGVADEKKSQILQKGQSIIQTMRSVGSDSPPGFGSAGSETQMGSVMGTPAYMPPEQALGEIDQMDERADVFGLGAILCEVLTGKPPYVGTDGTAVFRQASRGKLDDCMARLDACGADEDLVALAKHCLELDPKDRPRDAGTLAERVTGYLESVETKLRQTEIKRAAEAARAVEARKRMRVTLALAATVLLSLGIGGAGWRWMELQAIQRREVATTKVHNALSDAQLHQSLADSAELETQAVELDKAVASAQQAAELASTEEVEASLISRATTLLADLESRANSVQKLAEQARRDQEFKTELELIRLNQSDGATVTVTLAAQVEPRKATIVVADTQEGPESPNGDQRDADSDPETSGETPDAGPDRSRDGQSDAVPGPESAVVQLFDISTTLQRYEEAFRNAGFDLPALPVAEAAELIRSSAIQETLIDAIDNWARAFDESKSSVEGNPSSDEAASLSRAKLLAIANAADGSEWRRAVRAALERNDTAQLKELAGTDEARSQSPELIAWLGAALRNGDEIDRSVAVLLEAQRNHPGDFWLNYELGKSFSRQGNHLEGLGFARASLGIRPESPAAMIALAVASSETGRHADAVNLYRAVLAKSPRLYDAHAGLGLAATQMADWDTAIAAYRNAIELKPGNGELYGALALALRSTRRYEEAVEEARKGVKLDPTNAQAHIYLGQVLYGLRLGGVLQDRTAIAAYQEAIKLEPANARAYCYPGCSVDELRTAIQLDPQFAEAHATLGDMLFAQKKFDESLAACEKAMEVAPNSSLGYRKSIPPLLKLGRDSHAVANGRRAIVLNPQDGQAHAWLGEALRSQGNLKDAIELQRHAVELEPENWWVVEKLAESLKSQGMSDSFAIHSQILEWVPESTAAAMALSQTFQNQNVPADLSQFRDLVDRNLRNSQFLNNTAWWLVTHRDEQGQFQHLDDAVRWAKTASELEPEDGMILNTLGVAYYRQGEWRAAIDALQKSQSQNRGEPSDALFLAMAYQKLGDRSQSLEHYLQALTLRGTNNFDSETESFYTEARLLLDLQREGLETLLAREPDNAGITREFADLLLGFNDKAWTVLEPTDMKSEGGATLTKLDDNSVLASGENPVGDTYTIITRASGTQINSLRLEALTHESLPNQGPGRQQRDAGNFGIVQFDVSQQERDGTVRPLVLGTATSDYTRIPITMTEWNCAGGGSKPHTAVYSLQHPLEAVTDGRIQFQMRFSANADWPGGNLGRFRLSISDDPSAFVWEKTRFAAMKLTDPWAKLAAARHIVGDQQAFDKLLERLPVAAVELAGFLTERGKSLLAAKFNNEALSQLLEARELVGSVAAKYPETEWTVLQPTTVTSEGGATLTRLGDHSILASGTNPDKEVYEFEAELEGGEFTAIRLEGLTHPSLADGSHGRSSNGNVVLTDFEAEVASADSADDWGPLTFNDAWTDHPEASRTLKGAIDAISEYGWTTDHWGVPLDRTAIFTAESPFGHKAGTRLRIRLRHESQWERHTFGRMRLSVTNASNVIEAAPVQQQLRGFDMAGLEIALGNAYSQLGQVDEAVTAFHQALDLTDDHDARTKIIQTASAFDGVLDKLTKLRPKDAALQDTLARHSQASGDTVAALAAAATARLLYEQQLAAEPMNSLLAQSLADLLLLDAEMATTWTILEPTEMTSERGATLTLLDDGSILAGGENSPGESYHLVMQSDLNSITACRLEVLTDPSLPGQGPGRGKSGNFDIRWSFQDANPTGSEDAGPIRIRSAIADFSYARIPSTDSRWNIAGGGEGLPHMAFLALDAPLQNEAGNSFTLTIRGPNGGQYGDENLGRFRISVTDDPFAYENASVRIAAMKFTDPWARLAAAYDSVGDQPALARVLEQHPEAASLELAQFLAERGKISLAAQRVNEALPQLVEARELFASISAKHPPSNWTVLEPTKMTSAGGATLTKLDDHSILASGVNPEKEVYEFETELEGGDFTAIRLEGLTHPSLENGSHGRSIGNGNVKLTEFEAEVASAETPEDWRPIQFNNAWTGHPEAGRNLDNAIDGDRQTGWSTYHKDVPLDRTAIFTAETPFGHKSGSRLRIRLRHESEWDRHAFGRIRLSVTSDPHAIEVAPFQQQLQESDLAGLEFALGDAYGQLGKFDEAATAFHQALELTDTPDARTKIVQAASAYEGVLEQLTRLRPDDAALFDALARQSLGRGDFSTARTAAATARVLYEQQLAAEPMNSLLAQPLADLLLLDAEMATAWTILEPTVMTSKGGATLTLLEDRSILASGTNAPRDQYHLEFVVPADVDLRSVRLEALTDPSLPADGPGRDTKGSFVLNQWQLTATPKEGSEARTLSFDSAVADYEYRDYPIKPNGWWSIDGGPSSNRVAIWQATDSPHLTQGTTLKLLLDFDRDERVTNLGRFRLSISDNSRACDLLTAQKLTDPWAKLAAVYHVVGDQQQLDKLLAAHPEAKSSIDSLNGLSWLRDLRASGVAFKSGKQLPDGTWELDLEGATITDLAILKGPPISRLSLKKTAVSDLTPLRGLPLKHLNLEGTNVTDLTPLQGMPLENLVLTGLPISDLTPLSGLPISKLWLGNTAVTDLESLRGMSLTLLQIFNTTVTDLSPLHGMPLDYLHISGTKVTDLAPLRGMPLTSLRLHACTELTGVSPLADCKELKQVTLPPQAKDCEFLRTLPKLERLSFKQDNRPGSYGPDKTVEEFWKEYDATKK